VIGVKIDFMVTNVQKLVVINVCWAVVMQLGIVCLVVKLTGQGENVINNVVTLNIA
jgi:hypothetical protein